MKNQQQQEARELYFNSNLSKTEIAERINVSRRTIYQWSVDCDWEKLRQSARHMPAILAEKCAYLIGHFTDQLLSADASEIAISKKDVDMLHKLTITMHKLKKGSTVADNMETFTYLMERIHHKDPALAQQVAPHIEEYITDRRGKDESSFILHGFDDTGHLPYSENEQDEKRLDEEDAAAILADQQKAQQPTRQTTSQPKQDPAKAQQPGPKPTHDSLTQSHPYTGLTKPRPVHTPLHVTPPPKQTVIHAAA